MYSGLLRVYTRKCTLGCSRVYTRARADFMELRKFRVCVLDCLCVYARARVRTRACVCSRVGLRARVRGLLHFHRQASPGLCVINVCVERVCARAQLCVERVCARPAAVRALLQHVGHRRYL